MTKNFKIAYDNGDELNDVCMSLSYWLDDDRMAGESGDGKHFFIPVDAHMGRI